MNENLSKGLLALQAVIIVFPITLAFLFYSGLGLTIIDAYLITDAILMYFAIAVISLALLFGWYLIIQFILKGRDGLRHTNLWSYIFPVIGAIVVAVCGMYLLYITLNDTYPSSSFISTAAAAAGIGLPLVLPFAHILIESYVSKR